MFILKAVTGVWAKKGGNDAGSIPAALSLLRAKAILAIDGEITISRKNKKASNTLAKRHSNTADIFLQT